MKKIQILFITLALLLPSLTFGKSVYCVNCSDKWTQAIEKATSLEQLTKISAQLQEDFVQTEQQIRMVLQNIEQYENMIKNTIALPREITAKLNNEYNRLAALYKDVKTYNGDIQGLRNAYNGMFGSYDQVKEAGGKGYQENWQTWSNTVDQASRSTFEQSGRQLQDLQNSKEFDSYIDSLLNNPEGRMEAAQAGNQLTAIQVQEARELRALLATSMQEQALVNSKKEQQDKAEMEFLERYYTPRERAIDLKNIKREPRI